MAAAKELGEVPTATWFRAMSGRGVEAVVDGVAVAVGRPALLAERGIEVPIEIDEAIREWEGRGATVVYVLHPAPPQAGPPSARVTRSKTRSMAEWLGRVI